jgi:D-2-hydroxyacid dehydrogenase (NADP+)
MSPACKQRVRVVCTYPLPKSLVEQIRSVKPEALEVLVMRGAIPRDVTGYPSDRERRAVQRSDLQVLAAADVVFGFWGDAFDSAIARRGGPSVVIPRLGWVQLTSAGADRSSVQRLLRQGVRVTTTSGMHAGPIAEYVLCAMLTIVKRIPLLLNAQRRRAWARVIPDELAGKVVGVVGLGRIGSAVARLARGAGCHVLGIRRSNRPSRHVDELLPLDRLRDLLRRADFVVLCVPLTDETRGMIRASELRQMPSGAVLINVARGPIVGERALVSALRSRRIAGAVLDVFDQEPLPSDHPLWALPNVFVTPHVSGGTPHYDERAVALFSENLRRYLDGRPLRNLTCRGSRQR